jgi:NRE family putative nickel resistance protein-like MFS transporter
VVSLLGDSITWLGIALLAFQLAGEDAAVVLAVALTLRVVAFVIFSPYAGVLVDRLDRKKILIVAQLCRMAAIASLPFVQTAGQIYIIIFVVNIFRAFFVPALRAAIPQLVPGRSMYRKAIALYSGTYQVLGILGPAAAGVLAAWLGVRDIFFIDAVTFLIATGIIVSLPAMLTAEIEDSKSEKKKKTWAAIKKGTLPLFKNTKLRFILFLQLAASVVGAQVLVNSVGYVKGTLALGSAEYGWVMSIYAVGAALAAFLIGSLQDRYQLTHLALIGALITTIAVLPGNFVGLSFLLILWLVSGFGQSFVNVPMQTLIADEIPEHQHGRVYGAQFAWSHLWWALAYPLAGLLGKGLQDPFFFWGGIIGIVLAGICWLFLHPKE